MPKGINSIRKLKVKQSILKGNSYNQALRDGGYTEGSAHKSSVMPVVKVCQQEILAEFREKVTVEYVLNNLYEDRILAKKKGDIATATRVDELLGKYLAMFTDKTENKTTLTDERKIELSEFAKRFDITQDIATG